MSQLFKLKKKCTNFLIFLKKISDGSILFIKSENKNWVLRQISTEYRKFLTQIFDYELLMKNFYLTNKVKRIL